MKIIIFVACIVLAMHCAVAEDCDGSTGFHQGVDCRHCDLLEKHLPGVDGIKEECKKCCDPNLSTEDEAAEPEEEKYTSAQFEGSEWFLVRNPEWKMFLEKDFPTLKEKFRLTSLIVPNTSPRLVLTKEGGEKDYLKVVSWNRGMVTSYIESKLIPRT